MYQSNTSFAGIVSRIATHAPKEKYYFKYYWKQILMSLIFNYVHSVGHNLAYLLHIPKEPLADLGFSLLPAMSTEVQIISEIAFFIIFGSVILFVLSPMIHDNVFAYSQIDMKQLLQNMQTPSSPTTSAETGGSASKANIAMNSVPAPETTSEACIQWTNMNSPPPVYTVQVLARFLTVLMIAQSLRITSFLVTSLPGPNYHCRPFSPHYDPPTTWKELFFRQDAFFSCGDLVFSSHTTFILLCALTYGKYGRIEYLKKILWGTVSFFGLLVAAARKHYTVDIIMAFYTVPLIWVVLDYYFPDIYPVELLKRETSTSVTSYAPVETSELLDHGEDSVSEDFV